MNKFHYAVLILVWSNNVPLKSYKCHGTQKKMQITRKIQFSTHHQFRFSDYSQRLQLKLNSVSTANLAAMSPEVTLCIISSNEVTI